MRCGSQVLWRSSWCGQHNILMTSSALPPVTNPRPQRRQWSCSSNSLGGPSHLQGIRLLSFHPLSKRWASTWMSVGFTLQGVVLLSNTEIKLGRNDAMRLRGRLQFAAGQIFGQTCVQIGVQVCCWRGC